MHDANFARDVSIALILAIVFGAGVYGALNAAARVNHAYEIARV